MKCSICDGQIKVEHSDWAEGANAYPVTNGRCCHMCDEQIVIPTRLAREQGDIKRDEIIIEPSRYSTSELINIIYALEQNKGDDLRDVAKLITEKATKIYEETQPDAMNKIQGDA